MPRASCLINPARSISRWLTTSASAGVSLSVDRKNRETRMIVAHRGKPLFYRRLPPQNDGMNFFARWRLRKIASDDAVYVTEKSGVRSLHIGSDTIQSSMRIARQNDLELGYRRSMVFCVLLRERHARVMSIGLARETVC